MKIKNFLDNLSVVLSIALVLWIAASFVDITKHNDPFENDFQQFSKWNIIIMFENYIAAHKIERI